jgi:hypothetical protein
MTNIQLLQLRHQLHQKVIVFTMKLNRFNDEFDLYLKDPFVYDRTYYRPYISERGPDLVKVLGIDGSTGELIGENQYCEYRRIRYEDLSLEELTRLHHSVLQGEYVLQILI